MKNSLYIIVIITILCIMPFSCQKNKNITNDIIIYRIEYGYSTYKSVEAIMLEKDTLFYFPNDSMLMTYKKIPYKGISISNNKLKERIKNTDYDKLKTENFSECKAITKNEYIIRYSDNKEIIIPEVLDCPKNSKYKVIEMLRMFFGNAVMPPQKGKCQQGN